MKWCWELQLTSLRCLYSWWAIILRWIHQQICPEENLTPISLFVPSCTHQAGVKTWQRLFSICALLSSLPVALYSLCPSRKLSQFVTCLIIFLTRFVWKKLPYVSMGWPEGRTLTLNSRWFSLCSEGHCSVPLLTLSVRFVSSGSSSYWSTWNDASRARASGLSQIVQTD